MVGIREVFKFLLDQGADHTIGGNLSRPITPLQMLILCGSRSYARSLLPSMRLLMSRSDEIVYDTPEETIDGLLSDFHGNAEEFKFLQRECCPNYYQMPRYTRVAVAARIASRYGDAEHTPQLISTALGKDPLSAQDIEYECQSGYSRDRITLVHSISAKIGRALAKLLCFCEPKAATSSMKGKHLFFNESRL